MMREGQSRDVPREPGWDTDFRGEEPGKAAEVPAAHGNGAPCCPSQEKGVAAPLPWDWGEGSQHEAERTRTLGHA